MAPQPTGMWTIRLAAGSDAEAIAAIHDRSWGKTVAGHGVLYHLSDLPALVCVDRADRVVGVLTMHETGPDDSDGGLEVVTIDADPPGQGIGTALLEAAKAITIERGLHRLWLITTNDNLDALRFYQRRGLRLTRVDRDAIDRARALKSTIPTIGAYGIGLRDELTLEWRCPGTATVDG